MVIISHSVDELKPLVKSGRKRQTIRPRNQNPLKAANHEKRLRNAKKIQHYWKLRTKESELLAETNGVREMFQIMFLPREFKYSNDTMTPILIFNEALQLFEPLPEIEIYKLAKLDGFETVSDFFTWFEWKYGRNLYNRIFNVIRW